MLPSDGQQDAYTPNYESMYPTQSPADTGMTSIADLVSQSVPIAGAKSLSLSLPLSLYPSPSVPYSTAHYEDQIKFFLILLILARNIHECACELHFLPADSLLHACYTYILLTGNRGKANYGLPTFSNACNWSEKKLLRAKIFVLIVYNKIRGDRTHIQRRISTFDVNNVYT